MAERDLGTTVQAGDLERALVRSHQRLRELAAASVEMAEASTIGAVLEAAARGARSATGAARAVATLVPAEDPSHPVTAASPPGAPAGTRRHAAALIVPVPGRDGADAGRLELEDRSDGSGFDEHDHVALQQLATLTAAEVERIRQLDVARAAGEELRRQHELTATITENATSALFLMDERGHPTYQNAAARELFGFSLDEIAGRPLHESIHHTRPDGSPYPIEQCPIDRALPERRWVEPYEDVFLRKDGSLVPVAAAASPILRDGVPVGTVVEVRDLTSEKDAWAELDRQHEVSRVIAENAVSALILLDGEGHATYVNPAWVAMTGFTLDELAGTTAHDAIHHSRPDGTPFPMAECPIGRALVEWRRVEPYEDVFFRKDGSPFPVRTAASPIVDGGRLLGTVVEIADITLERQLSDEREFQRSLLEAQGEASVDGLLVVAADGRIAWQNHRFREIWRFPAGGLPEDDESALRQASTLVDDPAAFLDRVAAAYRARELVHDELRFSDGTVIERYGAPLEGPGGQEYGYFWSFRDITERTRAEERLAELYDRERALSQRLQEGLLTATVPTVQGHVVSSAYRPGTVALHVGGDWFDTFALPGGEVALVVGDVVGHDVDAAAAMGQLRGALRALARTGGPATVLEGMDALLRDLGARRLTTLVYVQLDPGTGEVRYSVAGHPPPLVVAADGSSRYLWGARSTPLGCTAGGGYAEATDTLGRGETLVLYSDGLIERRGEALDEGFSRLSRSGGTLAGASPSLADALCDDLLGGDAHDDDVCVLAVHRADPARFDLVLQAERGALGVARERFDRWLRAGEVDVVARADAVLALNEAVANSIEHGHGHDSGGRVVIQARLAGGTLAVTVTDDGSWRPPSRSAARGRGLAMIRALMDDVDVRGGEDGTTVVMARALVGPASAG